MLQTAIILAGGFGTRLQSLVKELPKPMAPVNNKVFLEYQLKWLKYFGINKVCMSVGHLSEKIVGHFGTDFEGMQLTYAEEKTALGTGGGIRNAMLSVEQKEVLVLNGDSFFDVDLHQFYKHHCSVESKCSLALRKVENAARYGKIELNEKNRIVAFKEKTEETVPGLINGGLYLLNRNFYLEETPANKNFSIEKDFFESNIKSIEIYGLVFDAYFIDIGVPEDYLKAQDVFNGFKY